MAIVLEGEAALLNFAHLTIDLTEVKKKKKKGQNVFISSVESWHFKLRARARTHAHALSPRAFSGALGMFCVSNVTSHFDLHMICFI